MSHPDDPRDMREYRERTSKGMKVSGMGPTTTIHASCPFCGVPDMQVYLLSEGAAAMEREYTCKACTRSVAGVVVTSEDGSQTRITFYQTGGPKQPLWITPQIPRARNFEPGKPKELEPTHAHDHDPHAQQFKPLHYQPASVMGKRYRTCSYCGSAHPHDLAQAVRAGLKLELADMKYGWPHKLYPVFGSHNPQDITKFYTLHLQDASAEDKLTIERAAGLQFTFDQGHGVSWKPC